MAGGLVAALGWLLLKPAPGDAVGGGPGVGQPSPALALAELPLTEASAGTPGKLRSLSEWRGRPLVLNFWASWCAPCRREAPLLAEVGRSGRAQVVGVLSNETDEARARAFVREYGLTYPNLLDSDLKATAAYGLTGIPHTVFIDAGGVVREVRRGELSADDLRRALAAIGVPESGKPESGLTATAQP